MKKERICLVIPPSVFLLDERVFMSLGILKVAAVLENSGYDIDVLDLSGIENIEKVIENYIKLSNVLVFGLTATTPQMPAVNRIVSAIRQERNGVKIIIGGPHVTLVNAARKKEEEKHIGGRATKAFSDLEKMAEVIVAGDGEEAIFEALKPDFKGLVDYDIPELMLSGTKLNGQPFPARHLVDVGSYRYFIDGERALNLIAQLGCPYACGFCGGRKSPSFRRIRTRSVENIIQEIEFIHKTYGIKGFMFYDDELNVNPKMFVQLMNSISDLQEKLGVEFRLRGFVRANLFNAEQAKAMHRAGFRWLLVGFESGSEKMLLNMNKRSTAIQNSICVEAARNAGLKVKALMSIGHPGESEKTIMESHKWLLNARPDDFDVTVITVYPGTAYYDEAVWCRPGVWVYTFNNDRLYSLEVDYLKVADYYKGNPEGGYKSYVYTDYLTAEKIVELRDFLEKDVRGELKIPFNQSAPARHYEHSMGVGGILPEYIKK